MPGSFSYTLQTVNGDPFVDGGNINITTGTVSGAVFNEFDIVTLSDVAAGDTITIGGLVYTYDYLGSHDVRGDPLQPAAYIRITSVPTGGTLSIGDTFALDLTGLPGDPDYPNLQNGNTKGSVAELDTTTEVKFPGVICFAAGTMLLTPNGEVAIEDLHRGDLVETADAGAQPVLWIGRTKIEFDAKNEDQKPILIASHSLGTDKPIRDLVLSPQHKILLDGTDGQGVLAPAKGLSKQRGVRRMQGRTKVEYFHVLLPAHSIIFADGLATESFYPGETALKMLSAQQRAAVEAAVPFLKKDFGSYGPQARASLTRSQAEELPRGQHGLGFGEIPVVRKSA
ncbi:Hint domain-containing protein (plasmid) [Aliiroseovarius sp. M344]|uniref:Hint domain-containing protein n=1 Tax=Aliiroseovarius sp. M344 TaxID=2867010 RepID=UPI0021AE1A7E|nr:Hint domain-containing protein [Aliiroseovarius sp. M344]UWQ16016.1 Hint domain-containing protein [Aliiroseovarius sp. M344]